MFQMTCACDHYLISHWKFCCLSRQKWKISCQFNFILLNKIPLCYLAKSAYIRLGWCRRYTLIISIMSRKHRLVFLQKLRFELCWYWWIEFYVFASQPCNICNTCNAWHTSYTNALHERSEFVKHAYSAVTSRCVIKFFEYFWISRETRRDMHPILLLLL